METTPSLNIDGHQNQNWRTLQEEQKSQCWVVGARPGSPDWKQDGSAAICWPLWRDCRVRVQPASSVPPGSLHRGSSRDGPKNEDFKSDHLSDGFESLDNFGTKLYNIIAAPFVDCSWVECEVMMNGKIRLAYICLCEPFFIHSWRPSIPVTYCSDNTVLHIVWFTSYMK